MEMVQIIKTPFSAAGAFLQLRARLLSTYWYLIFEITVLLGVNKSEIVYFHKHIALTILILIP